MHVIKCPNCKADLTSNITVCEWCNFVINKEGQNSVESITAKLSELINSGKKVPNPNLFGLLTKNAKISMPIFALLSFILAYKVSFVFAIAGILFCIYAIISLFKKTENTAVLLQNLKADFESEISRLQMQYGQNTSVSSQIQSFMSEWQFVQRSHDKIKRLEWLSYGIILILLGLAVFLPQSKSKTQQKAEQIQNEQKIVSDVEILIQANELKKARQKLSLIASQENTIKIKAMIQLQDCKSALDSAQIFIKNQEFSDAQNLLEECRWRKIASDYDMEIIEEVYYRQFAEYKNDLIKKLPGSYVVQKENQFNF